MDYGIGIPSYIDAWREVQAAEAAGFTHAWFYDSQLIYSDVYATMALAAQNTSRIKLGTLVAIPTNRMLGGIYMGSVFAPNHKGMPMLDKDTELDFLHQQVLTARDVQGSPLADFWYGGLNYQIEHHLFPNMPRNNLKKSQPIVRSFLKEKGIPYHETGVWQSHKDILGFLHEVSAPLRQKKS